MIKSYNDKTVKINLEAVPHKISRHATHCYWKHVISAFCDLCTDMKL